MNQKTIIKIIQLSKNILISYIRRAYYNAKMWVLGTKLEQEKKDANEAKLAADYLANDFESQYDDYLRRRAQRAAINEMRRTARQMRDNGKSPKDSN